MTSQPKPRASKTDSDTSESPVGVTTRMAVLDIIAAGLAQRGGFDAALTRPPFSTLADARERASARALAATVFRRLGPIDRALDAKLKRPPPEVVRNILRLGAAQLLFRDTPDFAAVSSAVDLANAVRGGAPFAGLVNAVLRGLARERGHEPDAEVHAPPWLYARWRAAYGDTVATAIAAEIPREPLTDLSLRDPESEAWGTAALAEALPAQALPGGSLRTERRGDIAEWPGFAEGAWWIQDAAAAAPVRLLDPRPGEAVLDLCAAPGGKTLQLAAAGARVTALDRSAGRLVRLTENLTRMGMTAEVVTAEAAAWKDGRSFDAVLLDAPCSATGTFRRHPDLLWAAQPGDIPKLADVQARLLTAAADRVKPGGRLIYCVCSIEPEEGEAQVAQFLAKRSDFRAAPADPEAVGLPA
ncbi:MAG: RsmB/NOP family class I SAM-dependent RNA methyltransferase, partial [Caulobacteraceae bacterium]